MNSMWEHQLTIEGDRTPANSNIRSFVDSLAETEMTNDQKRRYWMLNSADSEGLQLDIIEHRYDAMALRERFERWVAIMPSLETIARAVRKRGDTSKQSNGHESTIVRNAVSWYSRYLDSLYWKTWTTLVKQHYGYSCMACATDKNLQSHHRHYKTLGNEDYPDMAVFCDEHHELISGHMNIWIPTSPPLAVQRILKRENRIAIDNPTRT